MSSLSLKQKCFLTLFISITTLYIVLALMGGVKNYSFAPLYDSWEGFLGIYLKVLEGDWLAWWAQHNEHRPLLARLLFWIDLSFFKGRNYFLLLMNYLLPMVSFAFLYSFLKRRLP